MMALEWFRSGSNLYRQICREALPPPGYSPGAKVVTVILEAIVVDYSRVPPFKIQTIEVISADRLHCVLGECRTIEKARRTADKYLIEWAKARGETLTFEEDEA